MIVTQKSKKIPTLSHEKLITYLNYKDLNKIYDSINITMIRAINSYGLITKEIETSIEKAKYAIKEDYYLDSKTTNNNLAKHISICIISLCSVLDLMAKMRMYINLLNKHGKVIIITEKLNKTKYGYQILKQIASIKSLIDSPTIKALLEIRNDIVHNASTIDIEDHFYIRNILFETDGYITIFQPYFRDLDQNGNAIDLYGDKYQIKQENSLEMFFQDAIVKIFELIRGFQTYILDEKTYK